MKEFVKYTLATITGIILSGVAVFVLSLFTISAIIAAGSKTQDTVEKNSIIKIELEGSMQEQAGSKNPVDFIMGEESSYISTQDLYFGLRNAKKEDNIKGIFIEAKDFISDIASLEETRDLLKGFKDSGKFIIAYSDNYSMETYYLSSVADQVIINPQGSVTWDGIAAQVMFYKEAMEKLGIDMQVFKVGTYKSAVEPYLLNDMSDASREQMQDYLGSTWDTMCKDVSASRGISIERLNEMADDCVSLRKAEDLLALGLVDKLMYRSEVDGFIKEKMGLKEKDDLSTYDISTAANLSVKRPKRKDGGIISLYYANGEIDNTTSLLTLDSGIDSEKVIKDLKDLEEDDDVDAVVFRVNSPGGSAFGSEQIWKAIKDLKAVKPVIVSMSDYAASGGYYISCGADAIIAEPTTLTGSIGIFGMMPNVRGLLDKVGLNVETVKTNKHSDLMTGTRSMDDEEKSMIQKEIEKEYDLFLTRCSEGRGIEKSVIDSYAQGRVWTGEEAKEIGLVDELGGLEKALEIAAERSGISDDYRVMIKKSDASLINQIINGFMGAKIKEKALSGEMGKFLKDVDFIENIERNDRIQALLPFSILVR